MSHTLALMVIGAGTGWLFMSIIMLKDVYRKGQWRR